MTNKVDPSLIHYGGVLSDRDIRQYLKSKKLEINSPLKLKIQPASVDVHLAKTIMIFSRRRNKNIVIDLKKPVDEYVDYEVLDSEKGTIVHPHEFILGVTVESLTLPANMIANVEGKSSLGRLGLVIHATAGFVDPGWKGHITLEITNLTDQPLIIYPNMPIGQIRFSQLCSDAEYCYGDPKLGSKYINGYSKNPKPMPSQYWKNFHKQ